MLERETSKRMHTWTYIIGIMTILYTAMTFIMLLRILRNGGKLAIIEWEKVAGESGSVYFMSDNINTFDKDGELRLTIMASLAQDESRKTSERVKHGQKKSMEKTPWY